MTMTEPDNAQPVGPYATAARIYWESGWRGILPIPHGQKAPVPTGWTGRDGAWPSFADIHAWTEERGAGNIALRLPPGVLGIDCDHYGSKPGGAVLADLETRLGPLPATWRTTSRDDGISGIRLYRIPEGLRWPGVLGPGIETIRTEHRYAVTWPSLHPGGSTYRWITPDGATALTDVPNVDDLPDLPAAWVEHFTKGEHATDQPRAGLTGNQIGGWLTERGGRSVELCGAMTTALNRSARDLLGASSRHDAALAGTNRLVWLAGEGHLGGSRALAQLHDAFMAAVAGDRAAGDAEAEWDRMVDGAVDIAAAAHPTPSPDPCLSPFPGIIPPQENPWKTSSPSSSSPTKAPSTSSTSSASTTPSPAASASTAEDPSATSASTGRADDRERTSWWPRNVDGVLTGEDPESPPGFLTRSDGHSVWYRGKVNGIIGPSESGKTFVALHGAVQAIADGQRVTILDFEDTERGVIARLAALGVHADRIREQVAYINPDEPFSTFAPTGLDLLEHLDSWCPDLIILDGFNAAMTLQGYDLISNRDATAFSQLILKPLTRNDACVVYVDHVAKNKENTAAGGIGAQAKRAMTTGCTLKVDVIKQFGKGQEGKLRLYVDKDRPGFVRGTSAPSNGGHWAGDVHITPGTDGAVGVSFEPPEGFNADAPSAYTWRPTGYMERLCAWLTDNPGAGRNDVVREVPGNVKHKKDALRLLIEEGWIRVEKSGQKHLHHVVEAFSEASELAGTVPPAMRNSADIDPISATGVHRGPTGVQPGSGTPVEQPGSTGVHRGYVVPGSPDPGATTRADPTGDRVVERVIAGEAVRVNLTTGEVIA